MLCSEYLLSTPDTPCCGKPCHTLCQYVADQYFNNLPVNTTVEFLAGNNRPSISLIWITLHGDSSTLPEITSRIVCTWPAGFLFTGITDHELYISALAFISCGHNESAAVGVGSCKYDDYSLQAITLEEWPKCLEATPLQS